VAVGTALNIALRQSYPISDASWGQRIVNTNSASVNLTFHVVCMSAEKLRDHALTGEWKDHQDCHIKPNLVLICQRAADNVMQLVRLGSHSDLGAAAVVATRARADGQSVPLPKIPARRCQPSQQRRQVFHKAGDEVAHVAFALPRTTHGHEL